MKLHELIENEYNRRKANEEMRNLSCNIKKEENRIKDLKQRLEEFNRKKIYSIEKKYGGSRVTLHKKGNTVRIFNDRTKDVTLSFSSVVNQIKGLSNKDFILDAEAVSMGGKGIVLFAFDCPYFERDITRLPWLERRKILNSMRFGDNVKKAASVIVNNRDDAYKAIDMFNQMRGSKGAVIKQVHSKYMVDKKSSDWIGFKRLAESSSAEEISEVGKSGGIQQD